MECYNLIISFLKRIVPIGIAFGILFVLFAEELSVHVFKDIEMKECLMIVGVVLPIFALYQIFVELFRSFEQFRKSEFFKYLLVWLIAILLCSILWFTAKSNWAPLLAYAIANLIAFFIILPMVMKDLGRLKRSGEGQVQSKFDLRSY